MDIYFDTEDIASGEKYKDVIVDTVTEALNSEGFKNAGVDILLTDNKGIKELNKEYRQIDNETDCLSFPQYEKEDIKRLNKNTRCMLGDIVISFERAALQAEEYGHSIERELAFLSAHSTLHLLGYDHESPEDERIMFDKQEQLLTRLNYLR